jgi:SRSO17 transposase
MSPRFERRRKQLLEDALVKPQVYQGMLNRLVNFLEPYMESLGWRQQKEHLRVYVQGLLSDVKGKNVETIAYLHDQERNPLQRFIGERQWAYQPMLDELTRQVGQEFGEADGVIVLDPSGYEKDGKHSVGVERQWLGRLGKVDNGQVGIYLGYASRKGHALCDLRLYLSKEWARDRARRRECGVPQEIRFQTRHELAQEMLLARGAALPHAWIAGDDEMGRCSHFRLWLRGQRERYLLAVPSNTGMREVEAEAPEWWSVSGRKTKAPWTTVSEWLETVPAEAWTRVDVRDGEKGPLVVEALKCRVQTREEGGRVGPEELLFVTRVKESKGWKIDYYLSNAAAETEVTELARVAKAEHRIEECFKRAKSEAGLKDYEVRTWIGWHHHQALALMVAWFLTLEAERGKKWTPAITVSQIHDWIALLLLEALTEKKPAWRRKMYQRRALRKEAAYADHHIARNLLPPLRKEQRK